jgi:hypothetical protein
MNCTSFTPAGSRVPQVLHEAEIAVVDRHHDFALIVAGDAHGRRLGRRPGRQREDQGEGHQSSLHVRRSSRSSGFFRLLN